MKYFKILRNDMTHNGFVFKIGLNKDFNELNQNMFINSHGLHFADSEIFMFISQGDLVAEVLIPRNERIVSAHGVYKARRIVIDKPRKLSDIETIKWMVKNGANPRVNEDQLLIWSCQKGYDDIAMYAIRNRCNVNAFTNSPLAASANNGHEKLLSKLIELGAIDRESNILSSGLECAALKGYAKIVDRLISTFKYKKLTKNRALVMACKNGHLDIVNILFIHGVNPLDVPICLNYAIENGHVDIVNFLESLGVGKIKGDKLF